MYICMYVHVQCVCMIYTYILSRLSSITFFSFFFTAFQSLGLHQLHLQLCLTYVCIMLKISTSVIGDTVWVSTRLYRVCLDVVSVSEDTDVFSLLHGVVVVWYCGGTSTLTCLWLVDRFWDKQHFSHLGVFCTVICRILLLWLVSWFQLFSIMCMFFFSWVGGSFLPMTEC